jgi:hypothetical protein
VFSSEQLDLGLEQEVVDIEGNICNGEEEDLVRDELCGLQCGGRQREQSEDCSFKFIGLIY